MFSPHGRESLDIEDVRRHTNLLDSLQGAGFDVEWRENNSSSKGVAARIKTRNYLNKAKALGCRQETCFDAELIAGLSEELKAQRRDRVIVFHDMGSHGPAYWRRYPKDFAKFKPECKTSELWKCSSDTLLNTYDNTIVYTDHVLAERIRLLQSVSDRVDSILIYVSDHGESLGEHGLYLHGAPYALAPAEQTRVPYLIWMSEGYRRRFAVDGACLRSHRQNPLSHDTLYHTVLGALGLRNGFYRGALDLFGRCQAAPQAAESHQRNRL
jgi:lipid A ethanolaminephosphotransferase